MKRTPLSRGSGGLSRSAPMKRGGPLAPRSEKMKAKYAGSGAVEGRRAFVARILAERPACQACPRIAAIDWAVAARCGRRSVDVHELLARSAGGSILDDANVLAVCRSAHDWIGDHPLEALALGLRLSRYAGRNPSTTSTKGHS